LEEIKKQFILLIIFICIVFMLVIIYKSDLFWNLAKGLPLHTNTINCIRINDNICLSEDAGLRLNYYEASSFCSKRGMSLPTIEEAWDIWISSENCHRIFTSNIHVPKDKQAFINMCNNEECLEQADKVNKYCKSNFLIKFPLASQYEKGSYWLRDSAEDNQHYAIKYSTGKIRSFPDDMNNLGVRCVAK